ncbi:MAG: polysaccharide deacetylase family protein [Promethearchaeota archaeon]
MFDKFKILSWNDIKEINSNSLFDIIHHGHFHYPLAEYDKIEDIDRDIGFCVEILKEKIGINPIIFVYPFGEKSHCDKRTKLVLKDFGFKQAWAVQNKPVSYRDPYEITRLEMKGDNFNKFILV